MPQDGLIQELAQRVIGDRHALSRDEAMSLCSPDLDPHKLMFWANRIRRHYKGDVVRGCSIVSVRTGACSQDCAFCSQSARYATHVKAHGFLPAADVTQAAQDAQATGSYALGVVASGPGPTDAELPTYIEYLDAMPGVEKHLDIGVMTEEQIRIFKQHGLACCGHNLETSRRFFPNICTTHTYDQRVETLKALKRQGVKICSGGIFGMGETWGDRVDMAMDLRDLDAANVPLNFLHRIPGTPLADREPLTPLEILHIIALYRFILFDRDVGVYGGREVNLRDLQSYIFYAGANALLLGNYLTTGGRSAESDRQMIRDLGLRLESH
jgi:biotin synthase